MQVTVNGNPMQLPADSTVADMVAHLGHAGKRIAVERNGSIVPKSQHGSAGLTDNDRIEIVVAVGGG